MKRRPACVVSANAYQRSPDVIVAMVTSQAGRRQAPGLGDVVVNDWRAAGLRAPSTIRVGRLLVLEQRLLGTTLGRLSAAALTDVDDALRMVFGLR
jgi:mRNA-degrading endonuclease toxin of MazEF toxin-antitoxin module